MNAFISPTTNRQTPRYVSTYVDEVVNFLEGTKNSVVVECVHLEQPANGAFAFISGSAAVVILISELLTHNRETMAPVSDYAQSCQLSLVAQGYENVRIVQTHVVGVGDYDNTMLMAKSIATTLMVTTKETFMNITAGMFTTETDYFIEDDLETVKKYFETADPLTIGPLIDLGFVLYARRGVVDLPRPICAVGGYIEVLTHIDPAEPNTLHIDPLFHAVIQSAIPVHGMALVAMALAQEHIIDNERWKEVFTAGHVTDLGLSMTENVEEDVTLTYHPARLALDITEGRTMIPSMMDWVIPVDSENVEHIYTQASTFFGDHFVIEDRTVPPHNIFAVDYTGVCISFEEDEAVFLNSQCMDHAYMIDECEYTPIEAWLRLAYNSPYSDGLGPIQRAWTRMDLSCGTFQSLYRTTVTVPDGQFLSALKEATHKSINITPA